jgi:hypothetical protein
MTIHCGWILAATALNINVTLVAYGASVALQVGVAAASYVGLFLAALWFLLQYPVDLTPPCVIAWALGWIYYELKHPPASIVQRFSAKQIAGFEKGAIIGVGVLLGCVVLKALYVLFVERKRHKLKHHAHVTTSNCVSKEEAAAADNV